MRQTVLRGLAVVASLAMLSPAIAQQTQYGSWNQSSSSSPTIMGRVGYPLNRGYQDDVPAPPAHEWTPAPQGADLTIGSNAAPHAAPYDGSCNIDGGAAQGGGYAYQDAMSGSWNGEGCAAPRSANWVGGVNALIFDRDYEDDRNLSFSTLYPTTQRLFSTDADLETMGGFEAFISRRNCNNRGWELRYWGLFPGEADVTLGNSPYTVVNGLQYLDHVPSGFNVQQIYNAADTHRIYRRNEIQNFEFNILQNAGAQCGQSWEWAAGVRWFQFNEDFRYLASNANAAYPAIMAYDVATDNDLIGFQLGGRSEICLNKKLSLNLGVKGGVYGNSINARQSFHDENEYHPVINTGPYATTDYEFSADKTDVSFMGELDLGLIYQMSDCWRCRAGYRAVGVAGVALAVDQIPYDFTAVPNINRIKSNGNLLLHGLYFGAERSF